MDFPWRGAVFPGFGVAAAGALGGRGAGEAVGRVHPFSRHWGDRSRKLGHASAAFDVFPFRLQRHDGEKIQPRWGQ